MANMMKPRDNTMLYKSKTAELEKAKPTEVDPRDVGTPDEWIKRHPDMVRLTGRHPFNVEPPLPKLMEHGFITPASLHYVRNHGIFAGIEQDTTAHRLFATIHTYSTR